MERKPLVYHDLNLRFAAYQASGDTSSYKVWVEGDTPNGATMRPDDAAVATYDAGMFWADVVAHSGGLLGNLEQRRIERDDLFKLGRLLTDMALPAGRVRDLFNENLISLKTGEALRLRLHIDPVALTGLPWEYMALPQTSGEPQDTDFFALHREISIVRTDTVETATRTLPDRDAAQIVGVLSSPSDQRELDVESDKAGLENAIQDLNEAAGHQLINLRWAARPATRETVRDALSPGADIFHFAGHALFEPLSHEGKIVLERADHTSDFYSGSQLAALLAGLGVRLALLGACDTGRRDGQNVWSGVAPALTAHKIPAVIGNQFRIKDESAILLASALYPLLLSGYAIDEALCVARQVIYQQKTLMGRDWGVPVLYLNDKTGILFPRPAATLESGPTGPFIRVINAFGTVAGKVTGAVIENMRTGRIDVNTTVEDVKAGGDVIGVTFRGGGS